MYEVKVAWFVWREQTIHATSVFDEESRKPPEKRYKH